jgi:hypothetical protein
MEERVKRAVKAMGKKPSPGRHDPYSGASQLRGTTGTTPSQTEKIRS